MAEFPELWSALFAEFHQANVKTRPTKAGAVRYITARTAMNRLDQVLGPSNWWDSYSPNGNDSVFCHLTIRLPDGQLLTKTDAGGSAGMADPGDDDKSMVSDSFKRAAAKFGVGRYLYGDGVPRFCRKQADPKPLGPAESEQRQLPGPTSKSTGVESTPPGPEEWRPLSGRDLLNWVDDQESQYDAPLKKQMQRWAKSQGLPYKWSTWTRDQVQRGEVEAKRWLDELVKERSSASVA